MQKTVIYFLRHGEVHNPKNILYGRLPGFSLSEKGKKDIEAVARQLKYEGIGSIYTSPMLRTRQTANILSRVLGIKPRTSKFLIEVRSIFDGMSLDVYRQKIQPDSYSQKYIKQGIESIEEIAERMIKFLNIVKKRHKGERILIVSHGDPIMILKAVTSGIVFTQKYKRKYYLQTGQWLQLVCQNGKYTWRGFSVESKLIV